MGSNAQPRASLGGDFLTGAATSPQLQGAFVQLLVGLLAGLFKTIAERVTSPVVTPPVKPVPAPTQPDPDFPDDVHPAPTQKRKVGSVRLRLARGQYQRERFPEEYTEANPFGLIPQSELKDIQAGKSAMPWGSKFWLDLTPYDTDGREITRPEFIAMGLAFQTEHHCGGAYIVGAGPLPGQPTEPADYKTEDTDAISNGISAWKSSLGCLHQMRAWSEGSFAVVCSIAGVSGDSFTLRVS